MRIETERLVLRDLEPRDYDALCSMMDADTMWAYAHTFSDDEVAEWLEKQILRRRIWGFSLCAVELKETGEVIGQCGVTVQDCLGAHVPEIGYVFRRDRWHHGYATEAALACRDYAFETLGFNEVFSIIRDVNQASRRVALRLGMEPRAVMMKHYHGVDMPHIVYGISRAELSCSI